MSVELEIRLGVGAVSRVQFLCVLSDAVRRAFVVDSVPSWEANLDRGGVIGGEDNVFELELGTDAAIEGRCYTIGPEDMHGEDGGWWVCFSVILRTPESFLLLLLASACLGRIAGAQVLDESGLCGQGRWLSPADLLAATEASAGLSFADAARSLCKRLGVSFG